MRPIPLAAIAALIAALVMGTTCYAQSSESSSSSSTVAPSVSSSDKSGSGSDGGAIAPAAPVALGQSGPQPGSAEAPVPAPAASAPEPGPERRSVEPGLRLVPLSRRGPSIAAAAPAPDAVPAPKTGRSISGWSASPNTQYHIQTDEGPERYFKYQTISGQYRKEKRLQDGTVVGTYGWVDPNGYLRLRDYVADGTGYRVLKTKMVYVGKDDIGTAVSKAKHVPSQGGAAYVPPNSAGPATTPAPYLSPAPFPARTHFTYTPSPSSFNYNSPLLYPNLGTPPSNSLSSNTYNSYSGAPYYFDFGRRTESYRRPQPPFPLYDGVSATHNGFRYYLPRQYHEEETLPGERRDGSFGYVDPFGIRRVVYYNTAPGTGFVHRKNNRYVGFNATPYDPRF